MLRPQAAVARTNVCEPALQRLVVQFEEGLLTEDDRYKIAQCFEGTKPNPVEDALDIYLTKRLATLDPEIHDSVKSILSRTVHRQSKRGSHYDVVDKQVVNAIPEEFRGSIEDLRIQVHELEHVIQREELSRLGLKPPILINPMGLQFLEEMGAMSAEWEILNSFPLSKRRELREKIVKSKRPGMGTTLRVLESASLGRSEYLQNEWKHGRYSRSQIFWNEFIIRTGQAIGVAISTAGAGASLLMLEAAKCADHVQRVEPPTVALLRLGL